MAEHRELGLSLYDVHSDGSGCSYSSRLRPILNMRPKYRAWRLHDAPRHFAADLYLIAWLEARGFAYDVITDEDLHAEGVDLLAGYRVVLTGSHPEYHTEAMHTGFRQYLEGGGRLMYLGGNGFYWVTSVDPERPHAVELRRGDQRHARLGVAARRVLPQHHRRAGRPVAPARLGAAATARRRLRGPGLGRRRRLHPPARRATIRARRSSSRAWPTTRSSATSAWSWAARPATRSTASTRSSARRRTRLLLATSAGKHSDYYQVTVEDVPIMVPGQGGAREPEGPRRHGLLRDAQRRRRLLGRLDQLAGQPGLERLSQQRLARHRRVLRRFSETPTVACCVQYGSGEPAAPRRQSLLRSQARCALLPAATPR